MSLTKTKQPFLALSKICLNNWHYIDQKILSFNDGINFFTGHSGSGKSTVIDAMQINMVETFWEFLHRDVLITRSCNTL